MFLARSRPTVVTFIGVAPLAADDDICIMTHCDADGAGAVPPISSLFAWAHENERLRENVAATVRQPKPRRVQSRERGYTDAEALAVLRASRSHVPKPNQFGFVRETPHMTAAKRWAPILCAFSGARISEITQLRKEGIRQEGNRWIMRMRIGTGASRIATRCNRFQVACRYRATVFHSINSPVLLSTYHCKTQPR